MGKHFPATIPCFTLFLATLAMAAQSAGVPGEGWTVSVDANGTVSVSHDRLGPVMKEVRLQLKDGDKLIPLKNWTAERREPDQLLLRSAEPLTTWNIHLMPNALRISCASSSGYLTAQVPASRDRIPARIMDPRGTPVDWLGTNEVASSYGGSETWNQSYLPAENPEVMTFALGQVASINLHSLFDRKSDTVISFSDQTRLERRQGDPNILDAAMPVPGSAAIRLTFDYYTKVLGVPFYVPFDDSVFPQAPAVWCSWTSYYNEAKEEDIVRNTDWLAARLKPYGFEYVQIDDGYDRGKQGEHYWIERWDRNLFPHGPEWLARYIKSKGLRPGLWLVPNAYAGAVEEHPDWYLRDKKGNLILDYNTPALDSSNPAVLEFLRKLFTTLRGWGFEYYKFDGEHALPRYVPAVDKERLYDKNADPIGVYRNRLKVIREAIGLQTFVEGCPAGTPLNGIGYFNSCFTGHDVYNSWQGMYPLFSSINANAFLNHIVVYVMPGEGIEVGPTMSVEEAMAKRVRRVVATARSRESPLMGFGTTLPEARTLTSWVSLTGVVYPIASILPELPEERVQLLEMTIPAMPILPVDLFSRGTDMQWNRFKYTTPDDYLHNYPEILNVKVNARSGTYDVVGLTNWRSGTVTRDVQFREKLGLVPGARYVAFDFWGQKLLGVFRDRLSVEIESHDTRVILLHPLLDRPQLIGNSRHISGAYSILDLVWDTQARRLRGTSEGVPGKEYSLHFYVPERMAVSRVTAKTSEGGTVVTRQKSAGNSLQVSFQGQAVPVSWEVSFGARTDQ